MRRECPTRGGTRSPLRSAGAPCDVIATRCRVDDCLAEPRKVLTRPRIPLRVWMRHWSYPMDSDKHFYRCPSSMMMQPGGQCHFTKITFSPAVFSNQKIWLLLTGPVGFTAKTNSGISACYWRMKMSGSKICL